MADEDGSGRPAAGEILERVLHDAEEELGRSSAGLGLSGFAAGMTMGLSGLGVAILQHVLGPGSWAHVVAFTLYPTGFVAVIIGRAQLFTENTLYPVVLILDRRKGYADTARLWIVVFCSNLLGALLFAALVTQVHSVPRPVEEQLTVLGHRALEVSFGQAFWTGVIGGWLIALVAWLVEGSERTIAQVVLIWLLTYLVGIGAFAHCIATGGEGLVAWLNGADSAGTFFGWLAGATLGNAAGGVFIVSLLNYGQVMAGRGHRA